MPPLSLTDLANLWYNPAMGNSSAHELQPMIGYRLADMRALCQRITAVLTPVTLAGHRLIVHDVHPHQLATGYTMREHVHSYYEGHIVLAGSAVYRRGAQELVPGHALLHGPHMPHHWQTGDDYCLRMLFWFSLEPTVLPPAEFDWPRWPELLWDVDLLLRDAELATPGWRQRVNARVVLVISRLLSMANWPQSEEPDERLSELSLVDVVEQFMRDNLTRLVTLEDIAGQAGVSTRTLSRQFQHLTGVTVIERLLNLRMERAAELLLGSEDKLAVIAEAVGLPEPSYFCRCFRKYYHMTPNEFRRASGKWGK